MKAWLVDTGPLVALLVGDDGYHQWAIEQSKHAPTTVFSCEAVVSEAAFLLTRDGHSTAELFELLEVGFLRIDFELRTEHRAVRELMHRFPGRPMSVADACLVRMSELKPDSVIWTLDRDFSIYRKNRRQSLSLVSPW